MQEWKLNILKKEKGRCVALGFLYFVKFPKYVWVFLTVIIKSVD